MSIVVEDYKEKSLVVRGDTKPFKEQMKALGGKWNSGLVGGPGWIFKKNQRNEVEELVQTINDGNSVKQKTGVRVVVGNRENLYSFSSKKVITEIETQFKSLSNTDNKLGFISDVLTCLGRLTTTSNEEQSLFNPGKVSKETRVDSKETRVELKSLRDFSTNPNRLSTKPESEDEDEDSPKNNESVAALTGIITKGIYTSAVLNADDDSSQEE